MAGLCEGGNEPLGSLKAICKVQGLVIVLARGRLHVKKLSVRETSEQRQRNYHLPETIPQPLHDCVRFANHGAIHRHFASPRYERAKLAQAID
ncbi:hypothetical protein ANN_25201 [Periplaneta americana]|uniref:Uncharacterized protein n=1 Tax=Periplaneta americana TaxID=6978 RepID=A0ABQ8S0Q1_PERAM|nr:hypothetical protein ANN_25201 [Periplaneta americana]